MNIYKKIAEIKQELLEANLKKSGRNKFANFDYYELADITPAIIKFCNKKGVVVKISFDKEIATATAINTELPEETYKITIPMEELELKGSNKVQALGGVVTYLRRYLLMTLFDLIEADEFDSVTGKEIKNKKPQIAKGQPPSVAADPMFTDSPRQVFSKTVEEDLESQTVSKYNITTLYEIIKGRGKNEEAFKQWVRKEYLKEPEELTRNEYAEIIAVLSTEKKQ